MDNLHDQLLAAVKGIYTGLDVRIAEVIHDCNKDGISIDGNFYYLTFRDGMPTVDEFAEYVYHRIIPYCLPRRLRAEKDKKYDETKDPRYIHELTDQAKNLFAKAQKTQNKSGEPGEVVLFILLEAILKAPQIVCKMFLKTNEEMPVHGSDSVHLSSGTDGSLKLYWGESKLYGQISSAFDEIFKSIDGFISSNAVNAPKERDLDILTDHMDLDDPNLKEVLLRYFDPYEKESLKLHEAFACFVGFDYHAYQQVTSASPADMESEFKKIYSERISSACELFVDKMKKAELQSLSFHLFLLPFPNVEEFRKKFFHKLGVTSVC